MQVILPPLPRVAAEEQNACSVGLVIAQVQLHINDSESVFAIAMRQQCSCLPINSDSFDDDFNPVECPHHWEWRSQTPHAACACRANILGLSATSCVTGNL